jgi:predicted permease
MSNWRWGREERRDTPADIERELDQEIELHLQLRQEQLIRRGLEPERARSEAIRRFGPSATTRGELRAAAMQRERRMRIRGWLESLRQDAWHALNRIRREPMVSLMLVLTMALGIGANAAMFGIIDQTLLSGPVHVRAPQELRRFYVRVRPPGRREVVTSAMGYVWYTTFRDGTTSFDHVAAYAIMREGTVGRGLDAQRTTLSAVTADMFPLLGVQPLVGRFFSADEDRPPVGENVTVISYAMWQGRFGGDPAVLGRRLELDGDEFTVVGVAPDGFTGPERVPVVAWIPMAVYSRNVTDDWAHSWNAQWLRVIARPKPGVPQERAEQDATMALVRAYPEPSPVIQSAAVELAPLAYDEARREPLEVSVSRWLLGVSTIVLLIVCANVMNMHLARTVRQRREVAVRLAMGIGRWRLVRFLMMHGVVLALMGAVLALAVAQAAGDVIRRALLPGFDWHASVVDARVLGFTALVAILVGVLTSVVPAVRAARIDPARDLRESPDSGGLGGARLRNTLTIAQASLSVLLLFGAGLFARSLDRARSVDLGIDPAGVLEVALRWPVSDAPWSEVREQRAQTYAAALERAASMPGVERAAIAVGRPFRSRFTMRVRASGWDSIPQYPGGGPYISAVTGGFFDVLGLDLIEGRLFTPADRGGSEPVAIVDRRMARDLWPAGNAIGQCLYVDMGDDTTPCSRIVGVVEEAHRSGLREEPALQYYIPLGQERGFGGSSLLIRPRAGATNLAAPLRAAFMAIDPGLLYIEIRTLAASIDPLVRPWRLGAIMFSLFGALALVIATMGLYSVIAYGMARRTREIGVRVALGARTRDVLFLAVRQGVTIAGIGLVLGVLAAIAAGRFVESILFETSAREPSVLVVVVVTMLATAAVASLIPAVKAAAIDPVEALRAE